MLVRSKSLLFSLFLFAVSGAEASIFSRLVNIRSGEDEQKNGADRYTVHDGALMAVMENSTQIPLVGFGVGNLQHDLITPMVSEAMQSDKKTWLIDTAHVSQNEAMVAQGILKGVESQGQDGKVQVHVITKVWYTHLGFERTKLSIQESLQAFQPVMNSDKIDLRLHFMLHWPRCYENVPWMDCEAEENSLPEYVRQAGPNPSQNADAWKESWKVLEDFYLSGSYPIESIGVSNFQAQDLEEMEEFARVMPRMLQMSLWSLIYDSHLVQYCHQHNIHVQVFNVLQQTVLQPERAPRAFHHIQQIAMELSSQDKEITPAQAVLAWLIQHGVSVIPRTAKVDRLAENSAVSVTSIPALSDHQAEIMAHAVEAYLSGEDLSQDTVVRLSIHAATKDLIVYWMHNAGGTMLSIVRQGQYFNETTYPGHVYRFFDAENMDNFIQYTVPENVGTHETVHVDLQEHTMRSEATKMDMASASDEHADNSVFGWLGSILQMKK